jgi:hypothetical protein
MSVSDTKRRDFASSSTKKGHRVFQWPDLNGKEPVDARSKKK